MTIDIPSSVFETYEEGVDWMINNLGINAKIVYPPLKIECPNCYFNTLPGVGASNYYRPGGPYPFTQGFCPYCSGDGYKEQIKEETIKIGTYFDKKTWNKASPFLIPILGCTLLIGYATDIPKIQSMDHILLADDMAGYAERKYTLSTDVTLWGIKKRRYFCCGVERN